MTSSSAADTNPNGMLHLNAVTGPIGAPFVLRMPLAKSKLRMLDS